MANKRLVVELDAKTNDFLVKMEKAEKATDELGRTSKDTARHLDGVGTSSFDLGGKVSALSGVLKTGALALAGMATAASAAALAAADHARELQNAANVAGMNVEEMQSIAAATNTVGISTEQLGDIMKDTREKVGDFLNTGGGGLRDFTDAMNYSETQAKKFAEAMVGKNGMEVLQEMVIRMQKAGLSANEMSHALEGMGSDATKLIPLLLDQGKALDAIREKYDALSVRLTSEDTKVLTAIASDFSNLGESMSGMFGKMAVEYADQINELIRITSEGVKFIGDEFASGAFTDRLRAVVDYVQTIWETAMGNSGGDVKEFATFVYDTLKQVGKWLVEVAIGLPVSIRQAVSAFQAVIYEMIAEIDYYVASARGGFKMLAGDFEEGEKIIADAAKKRKDMLAENPHTKEIKDLQASKEAAIAKFEEEMRMADAKHADYAKKSLERLEIDAAEAEARRVITSQETVAAVGTEGKGTQETTQDKAVKAEEDKQKELMRLWKMGLKAKEQEVRGYKKWDELNLDQKEATTKGLLDIGMAAFGQNKAMQAGMIIADTASAAMSAYKSAGGFPYGVAPAAASVAFGMKQLAALKSATPSGGGSIGGGDSGGVAATPPPQNFVPETSGLEVSDRNTQGTAQTIRIELATDSGDDLMVALARGVNRAQQQGRV